MHVIKWGKRIVFTRFFHAKDNKKAIAAWKVDLGQIRRILNVSPFPCVCMSIANFWLPDGACHECVRKCPRAS